VSSDIARIVQLRSDSIILAEVLRDTVVRDVDIRPVAWANLRDLGPGGVGEFGRTV
jgi:hypothetical protein